MDEIPEEELNLEEREAIGAILASDGRALGPFSRVGWIGEAINVASNAALGHYLRLVHQLVHASTVGDVRSCGIWGPRCSGTEN
jgi:hypothetical protein